MTRIDTFRRRVRFVAPLLFLAGAGALGVTYGAAAQATTSPHAALTFTRTWQVPGSTLNDAGSPIALSSPNVATLGGAPAVVVGDRAGRVYAFHLADGSAVPGWPVSSGGVPVDSTPSVADTGRGGDTVFVGEGNAAVPNSGGYEAFTPQGTAQWFVQARNPGTDPTPYNGVQASMAVGNLQGGVDVVAGSLGENEYAMAADSGAVLNGFPWFQADSIFTTPAIADLYSTGQNEIVEGGDSTAGLAYNTQYQNGGHIRVLSASGNAGTGTPNGGLVCQYDTDQTVQSSPAVGEFLGGGRVGIVAGTGATYQGANTTDDVLATDSHCNLVWSTKLDGVTTSSPALADLQGNGTLDVVEGTQASSVYALAGPSGAVLWQAHMPGMVIGSVVTADLGSGYQDVIAPTTDGVVVLDGRSGAQLALLDNGIGFQNSPLVTDDPNGTIGITVAGYTGAGTGEIDHFELSGSNGSGVNEAGAWPMFHHDAQLTGDAGTPPPNLQVPCSPPSSPSGYDLVASDGGVFTFGLPFCGSTGGFPIAQPIRTMAVTADGGGYWLVGADGGIFAFGDAAYHGSVPGVGVHVNNIVGMASTPDGGGYWLVGSDGGLFAFGDAAYHGSVPGAGVHVSNIVGMAADDASGGYWIVGSDGGIFAFDAPFLGSTGNIRLAAPVVGMEAAPSGSGYRFVATDGGVFCYGEQFYGSMGGTRLTQPIVAMSGF